MTYVLSNHSTDVVTITLPTQQAIVLGPYESWMYNQTTATQIREPELGKFYYLKHHQNNAHFTAGCYHTSLYTERGNYRHPVSDLRDGDVFLLIGRRDNDFEVLAQGGCGWFRRRGFVTLEPVE